MSSFNGHQTYAATINATVGRVDSLHFGHHGRHTATVNIGTEVVAFSSHAHPTFTRGDNVAVRIIRDSSNDGHMWHGTRSGREFVLCTNEEFKVIGAHNDVVRLPPGLEPGSEVPIDLHETATARPMHVFPNWVADEV